MSWNDIPTCKESRASPVEYTMLRGIFMPGGVTQDQVDFYIDLFKKVRETPDWKDVHRAGRVQPVVHDGRRIRQVAGAGAKRSTRR